jgi:hypothetical protein
MESIVGLIKEIKMCQAHGLLSSAMAMSFVLIDTLSFLGMEVSKAKQGKSDFITWVDTYLKSNPNQPYQYNGKDLYGARCAMLHSYSSEADYHASNPDVKKYGYHDADMHFYDPHIDPLLVLISTTSFINDVVIAAGNFVKDCSTDQNLRSRVESRISGVLRNFPTIIKP